MDLPEYYAPASLEEALARLNLAAGGAQIIAGGTDLIPRMRAGLLYPKLLIDLRTLDLAEIRQDDNFVCLGAQVTHSQLLESEILSRHYPALGAACGQIGGPSIRNRGTLAGNLVNASPAADAAPPLMVYDADLLLVREGAERWLPLADFFLGPGQTVLARDELLKEMRLPLPARRTAAVFLKLGKRKAMAIAVVSVAVRLTVNKRGEINQARIALGSVAPRPLRVMAAENVLLGVPLEKACIDEAASIAAGEVSPISDIRASSHYRRRMVGVLVRRALTSAWQELKVEPARG
jgi:CO/xanthine dehydrogenase FAD-binding subunit